MNFGLSEDQDEKVPNLERDISAAACILRSLNSPHPWQFEKNSKEQKSGGEMLTFPIERERRPDYACCCDDGMPAMPPAGEAGKKQICKYFIERPPPKLRNYGILEQQPG